MGRSLNDIVDALPMTRQAKIRTRARELKAEYETLQELRKALNVTQEQMAKDLGVKQENVSRLEKRSDMLLSTLARAVSALGGKLDLTVQFVGRPPVSLTRLVDPAQPSGRSPARRTLKYVPAKKRERLSTQGRAKHA
jgi:transcriptional regulator with XRE-family HTH domain